MESIISAADGANVSILPIKLEDAGNDENFEIFRRSLHPIREALLNLDAETYLNLTRFEDKRNGYGNANGHGNGNGNGSGNGHTNGHSNGNENGHSIRRRSANDTSSHSDDDDVALLHESTYVKTIHNEIKPPNKGIRYLHVKEKPGHYSIGIFVFPPNAVIPLHNHPGMTVLTRVLYGDLKVQTYDIISCESTMRQQYERQQQQQQEEEEQQRQQQENGHNSSWLPNFVSRVLRSSSSSSSALDNNNINHHNNNNNNRNRIHNRVPKGSLHVYENKLKKITSPQITELYPQKGNVHQFTAGQNGAAVLDVLVPPYDGDNERDCTFYKVNFDLELPNYDDNGNDAAANVQTDKTRRRTWLVPIQQPDWFHCIGGNFGDIGTT